MVAAVAVSDNGYSTKFPTVPLRLPREHEQLFRDFIAVYRVLYERGETASFINAIADVVYSVQCDGTQVVLRPEEREAVERLIVEAAKARELAQAQAEQRARELEEALQLAKAEAEAEAEARVKAEAEAEALRRSPSVPEKELKRLQERCEILSKDYVEAASAKLSLETKLGACQERERQAREAARAECEAKAKAEAELQKLERQWDVRLTACKYQCEQLAKDLEFEKALRIDVQAREAELEQRIAELEKENKKLRSQLEKLPAKPRASRAKKLPE